MIYRTDLKCGPEPIPFGAMVRFIDGEMVAADHRTMQGVAVRPASAVDERAYRPGDGARIQTEGFILCLIDGTNTQMVDLRKGRFEWG